MTRPGEEVACAVSARARVSSGQTEELELVLVWDSPRQTETLQLRESCKENILCHKDTAKGENKRLWGALNCVFLLA